jgi:hypothetical protein
MEFPPANREERIARLHKRLYRLDVERELGGMVRQQLAEMGCEVWPSCWDLYWRAWIDRYGDEAAGRVLDAIEAGLQERLARIEAAEDSCSEEEGRG